MSEQDGLSSGSVPPASADALARDSARDILRNIQLQAPAGSGKTTVLAQRFLAALAVADAPEEVLAITFTRKAAAEMRDRVLMALEDRFPANQPERERWQSLRIAVHAQAAQQDWDITELPQRLRIQTIDSLAAELARAMPVLGRMQTSLRVVDDASTLYLEAARRTLREGDVDPEYRVDIDRLLRRLDNNMERASQLLAELLPGRNRWLPLLLAHPAEALAQAVQSSLARIVTDALDALRRRLPESWLAEAATLAREAAANRAAADQPMQGRWPLWLQPEASLGTGAGHLRYWQGVADLLLLGSEDRLRAQIDVRSGFPAKSPLKDRWRLWRDEFESRAEALALLAEVRALPAALLEESEQQAMAALARVLRLAAAQLQLVFRDRGLVDHGEVAAIARQALQGLDEDAEYSLRQTLRVSHLLVDECQDTSPDQLDLVRALTAGWQRGDRRSLFLVGDPMQSIYLFRGSEVGLFLQTRHQGVGHIRLETLHLTRNFRSQQALVQWANAAFARIFPPLENLRSSAVPFLAAEHARAPDERLSPAVTLWPQVADDPQAEAQVIAQEIATLRAGQSGLSIAVLVQTRALAAPILRALQAAAIPSVGVDLAALADRAVVRDLVALGQALLDAGDRRNWLAVLRSPPCGLLLDDLLQLCDVAGQGPLVDLLQDADVHAKLSADGSARLRRVGPLLAAAWCARGSRDIASLIETCWQDLGGEAACLDATELAAGRQYLLALRRLQVLEGRVAPERLETLATRLRDRHEAEGTQPVEVLTIHHAKGLEWDVVFVPGIGKRPRGDSSPLMRWLQLPDTAGGNDLLLAIRSIGAPNSSDPLAAYIRRLQAERQQNERLRLLYVAVTRARLRLYLSGHAPPDRKEGRPRPAARSLLDMLWPAVGAGFEESLQQLAQPVGDEPEAPPLRMLWHRLPADYEAAPVMALPEPRALTRVQAQRASAVEFSWVGPLARAAGTAMHAELERLARLGAPAVVDLPARQRACTLRLLELGIEPAAAEEAARRLVARLVALVREDAARWLLFTPHQLAASEIALSGLLDGELRNVVIDRMFVDAEGTRWIVDYKTGVHGGGGIEEFLARELQRYAPQLATYAQLASRLGPEPVRAALYFPWLGVFSELPAQQL
jgi:ATP-dependent helicase/nuclease subunit A